jgi:hypothetical protein
MIHRMCFDVEGSGYLPVEYGFLPADGIREYFQDRTVRFHCGVIYDSIRRHYRIFRPDQASKMVSMLSRADELVSFNGTRWDLIMLEKHVGRDYVERSLRHIRHHDLSGWRGQFDLRGLARSMIPRARLERLNNFQRHKDYYVAAGFDDFLSHKLSKCRCDVQLTYAVFRLYLDWVPSAKDASAIR